MPLRFGLHVFFIHVFCVHWLCVCVCVDVVMDNAAVRISVSWFKNKHLSKQGSWGGIGAQVLMNFFKYFFKIYKYDSSTINNVPSL